MWGKCVTVSRMTTRVLLAMVILLGAEWPVGPPYPATSRTSDAGTQISLSGDYVGLQEIKNYGRGVKWFHENRLLIRNSDAILDMIPLSIRGAKKTYSASDGGFLTYRARFFRKEDAMFVSLRLFQSDYISFPTPGCEPYSRTEIVPVRLAHGAIEIKGVMYKSASLDTKAKEPLLDALKKEPMEYTGEHPYWTGSRAQPACK